jgi:signal transduction histidine kinase
MHADTESALLRVAQGALANVREHSGATSAIVTLGYEDGELTLDVSDNGAGFDSDSGHAMVLRTSSQRMEALGGKVTIESIPGRGTVLIVSVPARERQ